MANSIKKDITPESLAIFFHNKYEELAPTCGYVTKPETREFDPHSPNSRLMIKVCKHFLYPLSFG